MQVRMIKFKIFALLDFAKIHNITKPHFANKADIINFMPLRLMAEFKRRGMSGDEIANRFGIDRVKEYNKANPPKPIRTSKHSKPGAPGFAW